MGLLVRKNWKLIFYIAPRPRFGCCKDIAFLLTIAPRHAVIVQALLIKLNALHEETVDNRKDRKGTA